MDQVALPNILLGSVIHRPPAVVRLLPPPPPPAPRPGLEVFGKTIQGLFFPHTPRKKTTIKAIVRPLPSLIAPPPPLPPLPTKNQPAGPILGSIQGIFIIPVRPRSPKPQAKPSLEEISDSIQRLLRHVTPAVCRPLALPLAAHVARDPTAAAALVVGSAAVAACQRCIQVVPYSNRVHLSLHSPHEERKEDEFEFAHFKDTNRKRIFGPRHYQSARVRRLTSEIVGAINRGLAIKGKQGMARILRPHTRHLDNLDWEVIITKSKECNAYVHPSGGKIVVLEGLLQRLETDAEIAAVIAHEVGHVVQRYTAEWLSTPFFSQTASLSRRLEAEADYIGIMLLAAAGYDPQAALKVCEKFAALERNKDYGWRYDDRYSTHPPEEERARLLSQCKVMGEALRLYKEVNANQGKEEVSPECGISSLLHMGTNYACGTCDTK